MNNNRITLKKLKQVKAASRETPYFSAVVCLDGEEIAHVENDGQGGSNNYFPVKGKSYADIERLEAAAKQARPDETFEVLDGIIYELLDEQETAKFHQRQLKKCQFAIVGQKGDEYSIFSPFSQKLDLGLAMKNEKYAVHVRNCVDKLKERGYTVLNNNLGL